MADRRRRMSKKVAESRATRIRRINLSRKIAPCPRCNALGKRHSLGRRRLHEVGVDEPTVLEVTYSKHYCSDCKRYFSLPMDKLAIPSALFTNRVRRISVGLVVTQKLTLEKAILEMQRRHHVHVPSATLHDWVTLEMRKH